jgi:hypothetical protein
MRRTKLCLPFQGMLLCISSMMLLCNEECILHCPLYRIRSLGAVTIVAQNIPSEHQPHRETSPRSFASAHEMQLLTLYECNDGISFQQLTVITACRRTTYTRNIGRVQIDK